MRRIDACVNCGALREIMSRGLCAKCKMAHTRAEDKRGEPKWLVGPDRSQNKSHRDLNRMRVNFSKMVALLDETAISNAVLPAEQYEAIKAILIGGIDRINAMQKLTVNLESQLTVNPNPDLSHGQVDEYIEDDS